MSKWVLLAAAAAAWVASATGCGSSDAVSADGKADSGTAGSGGAATGDSGTGSISTGGSGTGGSPGTTTFLRCSDAPPPGAPTPPAPATYSGGTCPALPKTTGFVDIQSTQARRFMLAVPANPTPNEKLPVIFLWHWLGGSAQSFYDRGEVQKAVDAQRFLAVIPEARSGVAFKWPATALDQQASVDEELKFFDDMLACVSEQFNANLSCVSSAGVSAGALWTDQLAHSRADYLSSFISLSGGTGSTVKAWATPQRHIPGIVLWGGPTDQCFNLLNFQQASMDLEQHLTEEGNFFIECIHDCAHQEPPFPPGMVSKYEGLWKFVFDHPYWLPAGQSPYTSAGLPSGIPAWCGIGTGSATPRTEGMCAPPAC
jgi:predicted esterase